MNNEFLRHTVSTIEYRFNRAIDNYNEDFGEFTMGKGSRTPAEIINHMFQVLMATRKLIEEEPTGNLHPEILKIESEIERFHSEFKLIDHTLAKQELDIKYTKKLLQGPFSDLLTHIGQLAMLQRITGNSIKREKYSAADIKTGIR